MNIHYIERKNVKDIGFCNDLNTLFKTLDKPLLNQYLESSCFITLEKLDDEGNYDFEIKDYCNDLKLTIVFRKNQFELANLYASNNLYSFCWQLDSYSDTLDKIEKNINFVCSNDKSVAIN
jgi:hypothetical protein